MIENIPFNQIKLTPSIFSERYETNREYLMSLESQGLLQNFYLEAGIVMPDLQICPDPSTAKLHWGWEAPTCQLRGHFLGHFLSAAAMIVASTGDMQLKAKIYYIVDELEKCQQLNGGQWIGSIPEKYMTKLERNDYIWSPQYVMHKTMMGLLHAYKYAGCKKALSILSNSADWYTEWTLKVQSTNPHAVYSGEEGGMLEMWAECYEVTGEDKYLSLAKRYSEQSLFKKLLSGKDALTNTHANASIPHAQGAAKMYEITHDEYWLSIVLAFWNCAIDMRDAFCTGGQNSGEYWIPPHMNGQFINDRTQEFCTVYNMVRLADYLYRFTKEAKYLDYIELNLYNGFLAQQHRKKGTPTYWLPLHYKSKKVWGSRTHDFWCCHGTTVQAQAIYPQLAYYKDNNEIILSQYIPTELVTTIGDTDITISQSVDMKYYNSAAFFDGDDESQMSRWLMKIAISATKDTQFTLKLRIPSWADAKDIVFKINNKDEVLSIENGFANITRVWSKNDAISLYLPARLSYSFLPDRKDKFAILEGPIVLSGIDCGSDVLIRPSDSPADILFPVSEHTYDSYPWLQSTYRTKNQPAEFKLIPLYDVLDEEYTVYFSDASSL